MRVGTGSMMNGIQGAARPPAGSQAERHCISASNSSSSPADLHGGTFV